MFRGEAILYVDYGVVGIVCHEAAVLVVRTESAKDEAATAEVDQDGGWAGLGGWFVDMGLDGLAVVSRRDKGYLVGFGV